jgi:hypothetical protein
MLPLVGPHLLFPNDHAKAIAHLRDGKPPALDQPPRGGVLFGSPLQSFVCGGGEGEGELDAVLVVDVLLCDALLDLVVDLGDDRVEVLLELDLQFLVVAAALVGRAFLEDLGEAEEDLVPATGGLSQELNTIIDHELQVDLVLLVTPLAHLEFALIDLVPHLLRLVELRLETLRIRLPQVFPFLFCQPAQLELSQALYIARRAKLSHGSVISVWKCIITPTRTANLPAPLAFPDSPPVLPHPHSPLLLINYDFPLATTLHSPSRFIFLRNKLAFRADDVRGWAGKEWFGDMAKLSLQSLIVMGCGETIRDAKV